MKKFFTFLLTFIFIMSLSGCFSKKEASKQVVLSNVSQESLETAEPVKAQVQTPDPASEKTPSITPTPTPEAQNNVKGTPVATSDAQNKEKDTPATNNKQSTTLVVVDAGHGGNDPGTSANGLVEKNVTLDIAKKLNKLLTDNNIKTYMIRTTDTFMDHRDRIYLANNMKASLYISIHCDWFENSKYGGTQTFYTTAKDLRLGELTELQYAKFVHNEIINTIRSNNRGITDRPTLAAVKYANMPSILIETGFLSNPTDSANLATDEYRQKIANAMFSGIKQSLKKANLQ